MYSQDSFSYLSGFIAGGAIGWISGIYLHSKIVNLLFGTPSTTPSNENFNDENSNDENSNDENSNDENSNDENSNDENSNEEFIIDREKNTITLYLTDESFQYLMSLSKQNMTSFTGVNTHNENQKAVFQAAIETSDFQTAIEKAFNEIAEHTPPPNKSTVVSGNYANLQNYGRPVASPGSIPENIMSRQEELCLINEFRDIVGLSLNIAKSTVEEGFSIHVLYIGMNNKKTPLEKYDPKTIGVRVKVVSAHEKNTPPTEDSMFITEIIDIGGVDLNDRGMIKL